MLLSVSDMPRVAGLDTPEDFYTVSLKPVPIAGMKHPRKTTPWVSLFELGFHSVVCLDDDSPSYRPSPLSIAFHRKLEDLIHGGNPEDPERERRLIGEAVQAARDRLAVGGIIIHCRGGTGRTGTVLGCTLRETGCNGMDVVQYLTRLNGSRGAKWPESPWQESLVRGWKS